VESLLPSPPVTAILTGLDNNAGLPPGATVTAGTHENDLLISRANTSELEPIFDPP
jgi:hypothetical protein